MAEDAYKGAKPIKAKDLKVGDTIVWDAGFRVFEYKATAVSLRHGMSIASKPNVIGVIVETSNRGQLNFKPDATVYIKE